jgi:membrane associated rhomboid family serine protease
MDGPGQVRFAFPRPGRALWAVLVVVGALNILLALLVNWTPLGATIMELLACDRHVVFPQLWRLVTSGLLTDPHHLQHLLFTLVGLYFLSPTLERRWGGPRFLGFLALSVVAGNLLVLGVAALAGEGAAAAFRPVVVFGPYAAISGIAIAWARENSEMQALLFFVIPVRGKYLLWFTLALCVLGLVFQEQLPEGMVAPFGGVITGMLLSGSPSALRTMYLRTKLFFLRRRKGRLRIEDVLSPPSGDGPQRAAKKAQRPGAPPLRVVQGGLDDVLKNRKPPKDKRYLN